MQLRGRTDALGELSLATCGLISNSLIILGIASLMPLIRHDLPLRGATIGAAASMPYVIALVSVAYSARITDRFGASFAVGLSQLFGAAAAVVVAVAPNLPLFFVGLALIGAGSGILGPAANVLSARLVSGRRRGLAMSIKQTGVTIGGTIAGVTLPPLAILTSWRVALLAAAVAALAVGCWGFVKRESAVREPLVLADRTISVRRSRLAVYAFWMAGIQLAILGYTAVYLVDRQGFSPQRAGVALSVALAAGTAGRLVWGVVSDRSRDRIRILQLAAGGSAVVLLFMPLASSTLIWPLVVVAGFCSIGWNGMFLTVAAESAGPRGVGRASSFILPFFYAGSICLPPLLGLVVQHASWTWFWLIGAGGSALAGLALTNAVLRDAPARELQAEAS